MDINEFIAAALFVEGLVVVLYGFINSRRRRKAVKNAEDEKEYAKIKRDTRFLLYFVICGESLLFSTCARVSVSVYPVSDPVGYAFMFGVHYLFAAVFLITLAPVTLYLWKTRRQK